MKAIMVQNGTELYNASEIQGFYIVKDNKGPIDRMLIRIRTVNNSTNAGIMGGYRNIDVARFVLGMLYSAYEHEEVFKFPEEQELEYAHIHHSKVTNRKVSHGGS